MSCFVTLPALLDFQGQAELFNLASALLTMQDNLLVCFLCRCQKDLRMFSLAEQRAPFGFQAVLLQLGGERKIGSLLSNAAAPGRPPPSFKTHQLHNLMGSMYLSFAKGLLNWLGHFPTPSMPTNHNPALLRCSYWGLMSPNYAMPGKSSSQVWGNSIALCKASLCFSS